MRQCRYKSKVYPSFMMTFIKRKVYLAVVYITPLCTYTVHTDLSTTIISIALALGMPVECRLSQTSDTLLSRAVYQIRTDTVKFLIANGAHVNASYGTPLMYAAHGNRNKILDILIQAGVNVNLRPASINTAIAHASFKTLFKLILSGAILPYDALTTAHKTRIDMTEKVYLVTHAYEIYHKFKTQ